MIFTMANNGNEAPACTGLFTIGESESRGSRDRGLHAKMVGQPGAYREKSSFAHRRDGGEYDLEDYIICSKRNPSRFDGASETLVGLHQGGFRN